MKALILDSGPLINFSINGLLPVLESLKKSFNGKFLITEAVKYEVADRPISIKRFELGALRIQKLLSIGVIEFPSVFSINEKKISQRTHELMEIANHSAQIRDKWVSLLSKAEVSCLALSDELSKIGVENIIAIDERTTRMFCENPRALGEIMSSKLHQKVEIQIRSQKDFSKYKFIRSSELVYAAYKKGLIDLKEGNVLEALLYATKFSGAAITFEEIEILKNLT
jgi:hypothetical protein